MKGIYSIANILNGDCYIGQSINLSKRKNNHFSDLSRNKHTNKHLQNAFNKYGKNLFKFIVLIICEEFELTYYEQELVNKLKPKYNICKKCVNSTKGMIFSEESRKKMSESRKGQVSSRKGAVLSFETKNRISQSNTGKLAWNKGISCRKETKDKLSEINNGKILTEQTKQRISSSLKGRTSNRKGIIMTKSQKMKISESNKKRNQMKKIEIENG